MKKLITILFILIAVNSYSQHHMMPIVSQVVYDGDLTEDLVAVWEMDELSGTVVNDAHGSYDGVNYGATINKTGKLGKSYYYNRDSVIIYHDILTNLSEFSISMWLDPTARSNNEVPLGCFFDTGRQIIRIRLNYDEPTVYINTTAGMYLDLAGGYLNMYGGWYNLVVVYDATSSIADGRRLYINGVKVAYKATTSGANTTAGYYQLGLGSSYVASGDFYDMGGYIDQTAVWHRALTDADVKHLYNSGSGRAYIDW